MVCQVDLSPEEIAAVLENPVERELTLSILRAFVGNGLTYTTKTQWKPSDTTESDDYRVSCFVKKSKETLIINTKYSNPNAFCLQVRIQDKSTFERLGDYTENVRNQILRSPHNCANCVSCQKALFGMYDFTFDGKRYIKCNQIHNNFWFSNLNADDHDSVLDIITREIEFGKSKR